MPVFISLTLIITNNKSCNIIFLSIKWLIISQKLIALSISKSKYKI